MNFLQPSGLAIRGGNSFVFLIKNKGDRSTGYVTTTPLFISVLARGVLREQKFDIFNPRERWI